MNLPIFRDRAAARRLVARESLLAPVRSWSPRRKENLLSAIATGLVSIDDVCKAHHFSYDELSRMREAYSRGGRRALAVTKRGRA